MFNTPKIPSRLVLLQDSFCPKCGSPSRSVRGGLVVIEETKGMNMPQITAWLAMQMWHSSCAYHKYHHQMTVVCMVPLAFMVDALSVHPYGAQDALAELPVCANVSPIHVNPMHCESKILSTRPAPPEIARESRPDALPIIRIADLRHRFVVQLRYLQHIEHQ